MPQVVHRSPNAKTWVMFLMICCGVLLWRTPLLVPEGVIGSVYVQCWLWCWLWVSGLEQIKLRVPGHPCCLFMSRTDRRASIPTTGFCTIIFITTMILTVISYATWKSGYPGVLVVPRYVFTLSGSCRGESGSGKVYEPHESKHFKVEIAPHPYHPYKA